MLNKIKFWLFGDRKVLLAFEYGVVLSETAKKLNVELTPEIVVKAGAMIVGEFSTKTAEELATDMGPNLLSVFELDLSK